MVGYPAPAMAEDDGLDALLDDALDTYDQTQKDEEVRGEQREKERVEREEREREKRAAAAGGAAGGDDAALQILESVLGSLNQGGDGELGEEEKRLQQLVQQGISLMKDEGNEGDEQQLLQNCLGLLDSISKEFGAEGGGAAAEGGGDDAVSKDFVAQLQTTLQQAVKEMGDEGGAAGLLGAGKGSDAELQRLCAQLTQPGLLAAPFRQLCAGYPKWLEDNADKCPLEDLERYHQQHDVLREIVAAYDEMGEEGAKGAGDAAGAAARADGDPTVAEVAEGAQGAAGDAATERIVELVEKLQGLGQPPSELVRGGGGAEDGAPDELRAALEQLQQQGAAEGGGDAGMKELLEAMQALQQPGAGGGEAGPGDLSQVLEALKKMGPEGDAAAAALATVEQPAAGGAPTRGSPQPPAPPPRHVDPATATPLSGQLGDSEDV